MPLIVVVSLSPSIVKGREPGKDLNDEEIFRLPCPY